MEAATSLISIHLFPLLVADPGVVKRKWTQNADNEDSISYHPLRSQMTTLGMVIRTCDLLSSPYYKEILIPQDFCDVIVFTLFFCKKKNNQQQTEEKMLVRLLETFLI